MLINEGLVFDIYLTFSRSVELCKSNSVFFKAVLKKRLCYNSAKFVFCHWS